MDASARMVIEPRFTWAGPFRDGLACVNVGGELGFRDDIIGGQWSYIRPDGSAAFAGAFSQAEAFAEGKAAVNVGARKTYAAHEDGYYTLGGQWGYVRADGTFLRRPCFEHALSYAEGMAVVRMDNRFGYVDESGEVAIVPQFDYCLSFRDGVAAAQKNRKYGYIDRSGAFRIRPRFELAYNFSEGLAPGLLGETYQWVFVDAEGRDVLHAPEKTTHVGWFSGGLCLAKLGEILRMSDGKLYPGGVRAGLGYLGRDGKWAIQPQYEWGSDFCEGRAWVMLENRQYVFLRPDGSLLGRSTFDRVESFQGGLAQVWKDGRFSLIDREGKTFWSET